MAWGPAGMIFFSSIMLLFDGFAEDPLTLQRLPGFYKQRDNGFYSAAAYVFPTTVLRIPYSLFAATMWCARPSSTLPCHSRNHGFIIHDESVDKCVCFVCALAACAVEKSSPQCKTFLPPPPPPPRPPPPPPHTPRACAFLRCVHLCTYHVYPRAVPRPYILCSSSRMQ